jgi:uncharacterized protein YehS (DUF1456 family)
MTADTTKRTLEIVQINNILLNNQRINEEIKREIKNYLKQNQVWWSRPAIPALRRLRQEDYKFEANWAM